MAETAQAKAEVQKAITQGAASVNEQSNPANPARTRPPRISLNDARQRLQTPELPGFHLHWFKEENVPLALAAYYEPVERHEITLHVNSAGVNGEAGGNTDPGSGVSIIAGFGGDGRPIRLHLMKLPLEFHKEDQRALEARNVKVMQSIFGNEARVGMGGAISELGEQAYIDRKRTKALFNRDIRKARIHRTR